MRDGRFPGAARPPPPPEPCIAARKPSPEMDGRDARAVPPSAPQAKLRDRRVLVVEDEALVAMLVEDELLDAGATVVGPAASIGHALRLIEEAAADGGLAAAVLDINLQAKR